MRLRSCLCLEVRPPTAVTSRRVPVLLNCRSGCGSSTAEADRLRQAFDGTGLDVDVALLRQGDDVREAARKALQAQPAVLVAAGGDGTLSAVADVVRGTGTALGVMPLGTLNHFAKDLGIPLDPVEAARTIAAGRRVAVDVGEVNGRALHQQREPRALSRDGARARAPAAAPAAAASATR